MTFFAENYQKNLQSENTTFLFKKQEKITF